MSKDWFSVSNLARLLTVKAGTEGATLIMPEPDEKPLFQPLSSSSSQFTPLPSLLLPPPHSSRRSNGHATPSKEGIEVLGVLRGRLFKAESTRSWTPLGSGDMELSIVQKKGEPFLTFFLTVGSNEVEVRSSIASSCDAVVGCTMSVIRG